MVNQCLVVESFDELMEETVYLNIVHSTQVKFIPNHCFNLKKILKIEMVSIFYVFSRIWRQTDGTEGRLFTKQSKQCIT